MTFLWSLENIDIFWIDKLTSPRPSPKYPKKGKGLFGLSQSTTSLVFSRIAVLVTSQPLYNLISCVVRWAESLLLETETGTGVLSAPGSLGNCCHGPTLAMRSYLEVTLFILCVQNVHICQKLYFYLGQIWIKNRYFIDFGFIFWRLAMLIVNLVCQFGAQQWLSSGPHSDPHRNNSRIWQSSGDLIFWVNSRPVTPLSNNFPCFVMVTLPENLDWVET